MFMATRFKILRAALNFAAHGALQCPDREPRNVLVFRFARPPIPQAGELCLE